MVASKQINKSRLKDWSDLDLDFIANPTTGDIVKKTGSEAIKRSIRNLVLTNYYDRPFRSYIGSNASKILFDNINPFTATFLKDAITEVITNFEPRVRLEGNDYDGVRVTVSEDNNGYDVVIAFTEINSLIPTTISLFLERLR